MWLPVMFLVIGLILGFITNMTIPNEYVSYLTVAILAAFDTLFGGIKAQLDSKFEQRLFITGFFINFILAVALTFLGLQLGMDLYLAAVFAFGIRLFRNVAIIRRRLLERYDTIKKSKKASKLSK
ncbi:DUF1290 domain-containing protein [Gracilibacillus sp. S3-1-1]|uniref:DUF1290 domain-containing protein n=1 Tax=Gracilibacillus pellucidus TaxID=3095368 RepID=A0ACC6M219_9BACI|nr:DUF1290 domain-containing protein [Gracilibacillus sp. S3-1-1]MDX8044933.1 DUF1290 domain-containing protein [Gracilibacillus sp. S3-1-1]